MLYYMYFVCVFIMKNNMQHHIVCTWFIHAESDLLLFSVCFFFEIHNNYSHIINVKMLSSVIITSVIKNYISGVSSV